MLQHEDQRVKDLLCYMKNLGLDFQVLGGYPRDLYFGRTPRDMDVCMYNCKPDTVLWRDKYVKLVAYLHENKLYESEFATNSEYPSDRIFGGLKTVVNVDIILWLENFTSVDSILGWFDFNINQFILERCEDTGIVIGQPWFYLFKFGELQQLRNTEISAERYRKTINIAKDVGWKAIVPNFNIPFEDEEPDLWN